MPSCALPTSDRGEWLSYGRSYLNSVTARSPRSTNRTSPGLSLAWTTPTGTTRGMEATPLVHDGVMYVSGSWSIVMALDARSGKELWRFDPKVSGRAGAQACCDVVNRGVALCRAASTSGPSTAA